MASSLASHTCTIETMWSYYGAKTNIVNFYPKPKHDKIIEPFAGTARYALKYFEKDVLLVDKYDVIIKIWKWLQLCSKQDILKLPRVKAGDNINSLHFDCEEARLLMGFCIGFGFHHPRQIATVRLRERPNHLPLRLKIISENLFKIKHWVIRLDSYENINNENATWYIDPPYQFGGHVYARSNKNIDYNLLGAWCIERIGQVIVCENSKANWMPFIPMVEQNVRTGIHKEAIWCNEPTAYDAVQQNIFSPQNIQQ
jgi:hypothetical protein